ncbi:MAG: type II toxin-antitoxin system RelE/ParE family toxin [Devosia sp.]|nr:type II toxin-antitoxin system RelE/ParE family toxin [Devosia sp.]
MKVEWTRTAQLDRDRLIDYLETESAQTALIVDERIHDQVQRLREFPDSGRRGRVPGTLELVIRRTPYIAAYRVDGNAVIVLRLLHGAQKWPKAL